MTLAENEIQKIINEVMERIKGESVITRDQPVRKETLSLGGPLFSTVDEAVKAARVAHEELVSLGLKKRIEIIERIREKFKSCASELARMAVEETGMGRVEHKTAKNILAATKTPGTEILYPDAITGDHGLTLEERAPYGVIAAITPSTNPAATIINNGISMIAGGNAIVFGPHPNAKRVTQEAIKILNQACVEAGGPRNIATCVAEPNIKAGIELMNHKDIDLLVVTGGPGVVKAALSIPRRSICAGPGNPPVVVDETADIPKAAKDIVDGATFDNNILCTAEKEVFAVKSIFEELTLAMEKAGAYRLTPAEVEKLEKIVLTESGTVNRKFVGKNASEILKAAGIMVSSNVRLALAYDVPADHPFVMHEMLMPIIPVVKVNSVDEGIERAIIAEQGNRHSAMMHSKNIENLHRMAKAIKTTLFVKNGPSYAGLGYNGEGYTTLTIAGTTGEGFTTARTFVKLRRCVLVDYFRIV